MYTGICSCGSDQLRYLGIEEVEGNVIIEAFRCEECGANVARETVVDVDDEEDVDVARFWLGSWEKNHPRPLT